MDKKMAIALAVVIIVIAAAAAIIVATNDDKDGGYKPAAYDDSDVRLRIFGNADGNDVIDSKDVYATGENKHLDAYVNYPIGHKVGCEFTMADILGVLGVYDYFSATDDVTPKNYCDQTYPGLASSL